jgi:hypothetical protein
LHRSAGIIRVVFVFAHDAERLNRSMPGIASSFPSSETNKACYSADFVSMFV